MDTRTKILTLESVVAFDLSRPLAIVVGLFDVLRAAQICEVIAARGSASAATLIAVVLPDPEAVLSQRVRSELAAGLRMIDYVVAADHADVNRVAAALQPAAIVRLEEADRLRSAQLIEHVRSRQTR